MDYILILQEYYKLLFYESVFFLQEELKLSIFTNMLMRVYLKANWLNFY